MCWPNEKIINFFAAELNIFIYWTCFVLEIFKNDFPFRWTCKSFSKPKCLFCGTLCMTCHNPQKLCFGHSCFQFFCGHAFDTPFLEQDLPTPVCQQIAASNGGHLLPLPNQIPPSKCTAFAENHIRVSPLSQTNHRRHCWPHLEAVCKITIAVEPIWQIMWTMSMVIHEGHHAWSRPAVAPIANDGIHVKQLHLQPYMHI